MKTKIALLVAMLTIVIVILVVILFWEGGVTNSDIFSKVDRDNAEVRGKIEYYGEAILTRSTSLDSKLDALDRKLDSLDSKLDRVLRAAEPPLPDAMSAPKPSGN